MTDDAEDAGGRDICFDVETTGFHAGKGDRVVEIAAVELMDYLPTGRTWHTYLNPERGMPDEAFKVHGLSAAFLGDKPKFKARAREFLDFIGSARLVAHNASFDVGFINAELDRMGLKPMSNPYVDTVSLARQRFPGGKVTLDDLCRKFGIDTTKRTRHEAMLDTELLARCYLELRGGRDRSLNFAVQRQNEPPTPTLIRPIRPSRGIGGPTGDELAAHATFLLKSIKGAIWATEDVGSTMRP